MSDAIEPSDLGHAAPAPGVDPVCGMTVATSSPHRLRHEGVEFRFCSAHCLARFREDPSVFLAKRASGPAPTASPPRAGRIYTCPMHPEVRQDGPGSCPKCGMALEPVAAASEGARDWTCPMHPEIVRDAPGVCPICGMALEPRGGRPRGATRTTNGTT